MTSSITSAMKWDNWQRWISWRIQGKIMRTKLSATFLALKVTRATSIHFRFYWSVILIERKLLRNSIIQLRASNWSVLCEFVLTESISPRTKCKYAKWVHLPGSWFVITLTAIHNRVIELQLKLCRRTIVWRNGEITITAIAFLAWSHELNFGCPCAPYIDACTNNTGITSAAKPTDASISSTAATRVASKKPWTIFYATITTIVTFKFQWQLRLFVRWIETTHKRGFEQAKRFGRQIGHSWDANQPYSKADHTTNKETQLPIDMNFYFIRTIKQTNGKHTILNSVWLFSYVVCTKIEKKINKCVEVTLTLVNENKLLIHSGVFFFLCPLELISFMGSNVRVWMLIRILRTNKLALICMLRLLPFFTIEAREFGKRNLFISFSHRHSVYHPKLVECPVSTSQSQACHE